MSVAPTDSHLIVALDFEGTPLRFYFPSVSIDTKMKVYTVLSVPLKRTRY